MRTPHNRTDMSYRANYATLSIQKLLGPEKDTLDVPWAEYAGDTTDGYDFESPSEDVVDPYLQLQAFDVEEYTHEIMLNGEPLTGFDIPPSEGWQTWMDTITGRELQAGENTLGVKRDTDTDDAFVVGSVIVHWREPTS